MRSGWQRRGYAWHARKWCIDDGVCVTNSGLDREDSPMVRSDTPQVLLRNKMRMLRSPWTFSSRPSPILPRWEVFPDVECLSTNFHNLPRSFCCSLHHVVFRGREGEPGIAVVAIAILLGFSRPFLI